MKITADQLRLMAPNTGEAARVYVDALNNAMERFGIDTPLRVAHFLGQLIHESGQLSHFREDMNYSANRIMAVWPKRFKTFQEAQFYERQPMKLANHVYANRMGNGDEKSGDGWKYRGAGWFQITGKDNHEAVAEALGVTQKDVGEWLSTVNGSALSAAHFFWANGCNRYADMNNTDAVSDIVNLGRRTEKYGDSVGFPKRMDLTKHCLKVIS